MRRRLPTVFAALLALTPLCFAGQMPKGLWEGCKEGSWVTTKTTQKVTMGTMKIPEQVSEARQTLVTVTDEAWTVRSERKKGDAWLKSTEVAIPRTVPEKYAKMADALKPEDLGTEKLTVDGKEYACKKTRVTIGKMVITNWVSEEVGVLKSENAGDISSSMQVTTLAKKAKIGEKEVTCRESRTVSKAAGSETNLVQLESDEVPGRAVRSEMTMAMPTQMTTVTETTAFEIR